MQLQLLTCVRKDFDGPDSSFEIRPNTPTPSHTISSLLAPNHLQVTEGVLTVLPKPTSVTYFTGAKQILLVCEFVEVCLQSGILDKYGVELIGAKLPSIDRAEDRLLFKNAMTKIGLRTPTSGTAESWEEAKEVGSGPHQLSTHSCILLQSKMYG